MKQPLIDNELRMVMYKFAERPRRAFSGFFYHCPNKILMPTRALSSAACPTEFLSLDEKTISCEADRLSQDLREVAWQSRDSITGVSAFLDEESPCTKDMATKEAVSHSLRTLPVWPGT
jgi:hypothetical protein